MRDEPNSFSDFLQLNVVRAVPFPPPQSTYNSLHRPSGNAVPGRTPRFTLVANSRRSMLRRAIGGGFEPAFARRIGGWVPFGVMG
jgi:hypothetical protein